MFETFKRALDYLGLTLWQDPAYSDSYAHYSLRFLDEAEGKKRVWNVVFLESSDTYPGTGSMTFAVLLKMFTSQHGFLCSLPYEKLRDEAEFAARSFFIANPFYGCKSREELELKLTLLEGDGERKDR